MPAAELVALSASALDRALVAWHDAWPVMLVAYAAAESAWEHSRDGALGAALVAVSADLISVAHLGLLEAGDIRLFVQARAAADRSLPVAATLGMSEARGVVLQRLGSLVLDSYTAGRTPANHEGEFLHWVEKALSRGDPELLALVSGEVDETGAGEPAARWPSPQDALEMAMADLRSALPLVGPDRRGSVLKALSQALEWRPIFGGPPAGDELVEVSEAALAALAPDDSAGRLSVSERLRRAGSVGGPPAPGSGEAESLIKQLEDDLEGFAAQNTSYNAWDAVAQVSSSLADRDPERGLELLALQRRLPDMWALESRRAAHMQLELKLFARAHAPAWVPAAWESAEAFERVAAEGLGASPRAGAPPRPPLTDAETAGALTLVLLASTKFDREAAGLDALRLMEQVDTSVWAPHADAFRNAAAELQQGQAVNLERRGESLEAVAMYLGAARGFLALGAPDRLTGAIDYAADLIGPGVDGDLSAVSAWCASNALAVELCAPASGAAAVQRLVRHTLASQARQGASSEEVQLLLQAAKGQRFAATVAHGTVGWAPGEETRRLLAQEAVAEDRLPVDHPLLRAPAGDAGLDNDDLVSAFAGEFEASPSDTPEGAVVNQQRAIERRIMAGLTSAAVTDAAPSSLSEIRACLDPRTALLLLYEGAWLGGEAAMYALLITATNEFLTLNGEGMPYSVVTASHGGHDVQLPPSGLFVGALRRAVQQEPAPDDVSTEGQRLLGSAAELYARPVIQHLDELRAAGVDRLIVVPHGAGHFVPIHLLGPPGQPLADQWTVTYRANLAQLTSGLPVRDHGTRREGSAVFALSYRDQPRLPPLDSSEAEARAIGDILGVDAALDGAVTEPAFTRALETCRFVHLRAHGQHNVDAPLFQTVFLSPSEGHDGRFRAHEVLALDLRGLELVTLGACETALGRVDSSDNLRGFPASLLLAGAQAIIGTMWPVLADASTTFFTSLYGRLRQDDDDLVGAFAHAQRETRSRFPEYRDWGAFYLTGG